MTITPEQFQEMLARTERNSGRVPQSQLKCSNAVEEESDLHDRIIDFCRSKGWGYIHSRMDKKSTLIPGTCDFVILADRGRTFYFECKDREGKLSVKQQGWIMQQTKNGHTIHVIRSVEEFLDVVFQMQLSSPSLDGAQQH